MGERFSRFRDQYRTVSFPHPRGECCICMDNSGLKMKCGHYLCPDDFLDCAWNQIRCMKYKISCPMCTCNLDIHDILCFGLPEEKEKQCITEAISLNLCFSQDVQQCPRCSSYCQRKKTDEVQTNCIVCTRNMKSPFLFCWYCLRDWKDPSNNQVCGNKNCTREKIETLMKSPMKNFTDTNGKTISIPKWRACPNKSCSTLIEHEKPL